MGKKLKNGVVVNPDKNKEIIFDGSINHLNVIFRCPGNVSKYSKLILGDNTSTAGHIHLGSRNYNSAGIIYDGANANTDFSNNKCIFYTQNDNQQIFKRMQFDNNTDNSNVEFFGDVSLIDPNRKFMGDLQGNASTASLSAQTIALETPRTIAGMAFDGTQNVSIDISDLNNVNQSAVPTNGYALIWDTDKWIDGVPVLATSATKLQTPRTIAGLAFDGTQNVAIDISDLNNESVRCSQ